MMPFLALSCARPCRIGASRSTALASASGSSAATFMASTVSPENENVAGCAPPGRQEMARPHQLVAKAVASLQTMDGPFDGQFESAVHEIKMMFEAKTRRERIVHPGGGPQ